MKPINSHCFRNTTQFCVSVESEWNKPVVFLLLIVENIKKTYHHVKDYAMLLYIMYIYYLWFKMFMGTCEVFSC